MITSAAPAPVRPAQLRPIRVGVRTHAGSLSCDTDASGGPLYVASCRTGRSRTGVVSAHPAVAGRIDCLNCLARHADIVSKIHAAMDAAAGRADIRPTDTGYVSAPTLTAPAPGVLTTARAAGPFAVWCAIMICADERLTVVRSERLRAAWVREALREVYGLSMSATTREILDARDGDTRDVNARARDYLAAYAGQLDDRAEPVDLHAVAYQVHDVDQVHAGIRPAAGTWVFVAGHAGRWNVLPRSPREERRAPFSIRVQQDGHTLNGSVALSAVSPVPPAAAVTDPAGWLPAVTAHVQDEDGVREESMTDAATGARAVEVWSTARTGQTYAYRVAGEVTSPPAVDRAGALGAVNVLDTVTVGELATLPGESGAGGRVLILADGTPVRVESVAPVDVSGVQTATPGGYCYTPGMVLAGRVIRLTVQTVGDPIVMRAPVALNLHHLTARPTWVLTLPCHGRVALAPACGTAA